MPPKAKAKMKGKGKAPKAKGGPAKGAKGMKGKGKAGPGLGPPVADDEYDSINAVGSNLKGGFFKASSAGGPMKGKGKTGKVGKTGGGAEKSGFFDVGSMAAPRSAARSEFYKSDAGGSGSQKRSSGGNKSHVVEGMDMDYRGGRETKTMQLFVKNNLEHVRPLARGGLDIAPRPHSHLLLRPLA